jgi:hypothetical protein
VQHLQVKKVLKLYSVAELIADKRNKTVTPTFWARRFISSRLFLISTSDEPRKPSLAPNCLKTIAGFWMFNSGSMIAKSPAVVHH